MIFTKTKFEGVFEIDLEKIEDSRGYFARSWDDQIFEERGLNSKIVQCNFSFNNKKGTIRGMHYQENPHQETKIVTCVKGRIFDVIVDLGANSKTKNQWLGIELSEYNKKMLYIPENFAHGFQTLEDNSEVFYQMSEYFHPELSQGKRWNDKIFNIKWPIKNPIISQKDKEWK